MIGFPTGEWSFDLTQMTWHAAPEAWETTLEVVQFSWDVPVEPMSQVSQEKSCHTEPYCPHPPLVNILKPCSKILKPARSRIHQNFILGTKRHPFREHPSVLDGICTMCETQASTLSRISCGWLKSKSPRLPMGSTLGVWKTKRKPESIHWFVWSFIIMFHFLSHFQRLLEGDPPVSATALFQR